MRYPAAGLRGDARRVAESLGVPAGSVRRSADVTDVTVVVGADWREGGTYPEPEPPKAGDLPDHADALSAAEKGACMDVYAPYRW